MTDRRWNLNIHYHRVVLGAIPAGARTALDAGCGDGLLSVDLADRALTVIGLDRDAASVARAAADPRANERTSFVIADLVDHPFAPATFDVAASIATLHHVDAAEGLLALRDLVRPGGVLVIVGFARNAGPRRRAAGRYRCGVHKRWRTLTGRYWSPVPQPCGPRRFPPQHCATSYSESCQAPPTARC